MDTPRSAFLPSQYCDLRTLYVVLSIASFIIYYDNFLNRKVDDLFILV